MALLSTTAVMSTLRRAAWMRWLPPMAAQSPSPITTTTCRLGSATLAPVATGAKVADPSLHVVVVMGDGDCAAIGGNHLIHAARRNVDITAVVLNNAIYGMTGGQASPATHEGDISKTSPYGNAE